MKCTDIRLDNHSITEIKNMLGKKMTKYMCDPFAYSTSVYGIVGVCFENAAYKFTNITKTMDHYGTMEDVAVFKLDSTQEQDICSMIKGETMISIPVNENVINIEVVNEHQKLFQNNTQTYETWVTRGVIFTFESGIQLSLEKNVWFSEDITIERGYDLIQKFSPVEEFIENWEGEYRGECTREIITLAETQ